MFETELIICIKMDLALNKLQRLIWHKTQQTTNQHICSSFVLVERSYFQGLKLWMSYPDDLISFNVHQHIFPFLNTSYIWYLHQIWLGKNFIFHNTWLWIAYWNDIYDTFDYLIFQLECSNASWYLQKLSFIVGPICISRITLVFLGMPIKR